LVSSNETASIEKTLHGDAVVWKCLVQEAEMGDRAGVKISKQRQNMTCFDPDRPSSHFWNPNCQNVSYRAECVFMVSGSIRFVQSSENSLPAGRVTLLAISIMTREIYTLLPNSNLQKTLKFSGVVSDNDWTAASCEKTMKCLE
jgi:hypothetical protein